MSTSSTSALHALERLLGATNFVSDPADLRPYALGNLTPSAAVRPGSAQEVAEIVKFAAAEKLAIVPSGSRTKLIMGTAPSRYDIALDLTCLNRIVAYDPGDLTLSTEPCVSLATVARTLGQHGQFLPLGAPFSNLATLGGTVISGVDGPLRQFHGTARDFVLGMEFVTGDGVIGKSGGRVVKNVAGYDLHKPLIGSQGTLAIVTKINLRTFPAPQSLRGFIAHFSTVESAVALRHAIAKWSFRPLTLEILSAGVSQLFAGDAARRAEPNPLPSGTMAPHGWTFAASLTGNESILDRCERDLRGMADCHGATALSVLGRGADRSEVAAMFGRVREFIPIALESSPAATIAKICVPAGRIADALCAIKHAADDHDMPWAVLARGMGVIYLAILPLEKNESTLQRVAATTNRISAACAVLQGHCTVPWCPSKWKARLHTWGQPGADLFLMRKLKQIFDPHSILSPGRFVGGI